MAGLYFYKFNTYIQKYYKIRIIMITLSELLAVISILITAFSLGYRMGKDKGKNEKTKE